MSRRVVIAGAGITGLAAARALVRAQPEADVVVLEATDRVGGLIETEITQDGFVLDHGPDSLVSWKPTCLRAVREARLEAEIVTGTGAPRRAFLAHGRALSPMPDGLMAGIPSQLGPMLRSPLLGLGAKARLMLEPLVAARDSADDESVADFTTRRFGRQVLDHLVDPLVQGIFGAPAALLSVQASMPQLAQLERSHGSVAWGVFRTRKQRAASHGAASVFSLRRGLQQLPDAFARELGERVRRGTRITGIASRAGGAFHLETSRGGIDADALILALPAHASARLLEPVDAELAAQLAEVSHGPLDAVSLAFRRADVPHPLDGTGLIVPSTEGRATTACSFMSAKWPGRAPEGHALLRSFVQAAGADDTELVRRARADLRELLGIEAAPLWARLRRRPSGLPRYRVGHALRVARMEARARECGHLSLAGNAYHGIGIPECILSGEKAAAETV